VAAALGELLCIRLGHARVMQDAAMSTVDLVGILIRMQGSLDGCCMSGVMLAFLDLGGAR
jgi:hypothetical protein